MTQEDRDEWTRIADGLERKGESVHAEERMVVYAGTLLHCAKGLRDLLAEVERLRSQLREEQCTDPRCGQEGVGGSHFDDTIPGEVCIDGWWTLCPMHMEALRRILKIEQPEE